MNGCDICLAVTLGSYYLMGCLAGIYSYWKIKKKEKEDKLKEALLKEEERKRLEEEERHYQQLRDMDYYFGYTHPYYDPPPYLEMT